MAKSKCKRTPKTVLKLPDLEQVLNNLASASSKRSYDHAIREFIDWYCSEPRLAFNKTLVTRYRIALEQHPYAPSTRFTTDLCTAVPPGRRRTRAAAVSAGSRLDPHHRAIPRVQTALPECR
jgi:hypothetical protein